MKASDEMPLSPVLVAAKFFIAVAGARVLIEKPGTGTSRSPVEQRARRAGSQCPSLV